MRRLLALSLLLLAPDAFAAIDGRVVDLRGRAIAEAAITLFPSETTIVTDSRGRFSSDENVSRVVISANGYRRVERDVAESANLTIVLEPILVSDEITVTATATPARLADTPASVVVVTRRDLDTTAALTVDDALRQIPGFMLFRRSGSRSANPTSQGVSLRGLGASGASRALVLDDGIPVNDPFGGWIYWSSVPRESLDRVEVVRGGVSQLYGSSALGGVISLLPRNVSSNAVSVEASYGSQSTPDASLFATSRLGAWDVSLDGEFFRTAGFVTVDRAEQGAVDVATENRHSLGAVGLARRFAIADVDDAGRLFARGSLFTETRNNGTPLQTNDTRIREISAGGDVQQGASTLSARLWNRSQLYHQTFTAVASDRSSERLTRRQRVPATASGASVQWIAPLSPKFVVVTGGEWKRVEGTSEEAIVTGGGTNLVDAGGTQTTAAGYAELNADLSSSTSASLGVRFDGWRNGDASRTSNGDVAPLASRSDSAWSPRLSITHRFTDRLALMASAYRSFRGPTLNELYRAFRVGNVLTLANENLSAEKLEGGELGATITISSRSYVRAVAFNATIDDAISNVTLNSADELITRQRQNLGRTRSRGVEIDSVTRIGEHWSASLSSLLADATVVDFSANRDLEGKRIPQVPRHQESLAIAYANPSLVNAGLQARWYGSQYDDDQNRFRLAAATTVDLFVSHRLGDFEPFVAIENLFDARVETGRTPITTIGAPRSIRVGLRFRSGL